MAGDTWVAIDGRTGSPWGTCWVSDTGAYAGPAPAASLGTAAWVPVDAGEVDYFIAQPNPDGQDDHVADGSYTTHNVIEWYLPDGTFGTNGDPLADVDTGAHFFVLWFVPGVGPTDDPATLTTPSASPLDLTPTTWVTGGRLAYGGAGINVDGGVMTMPPSMPLFTLTAGALLSGPVFDLHIIMTPGSVTAAGLDSPPDDQDLGADDPVYSEPGP